MLTGDRGSRLAETYKTIRVGDEKNKVGKSHPVYLLRKNIRKKRRPEAGREGIERVSVNLTRKKHNKILPRKGRPRAG